MKRPAHLALLSLVPLLLAACGSGGGKGDPAPLSSPLFDRALVYLQTQYHSPDATVRSNCIEAMQPSRDPRAADLIEQGLRDPAWVVRFAAAMSSADQKGERAANLRPTINTMVEHDPNGSVRAGCIYALRRFGDSKHMSDLATLMASGDPSTQANTAYVLGLLKDRSAILLLERYRDVTDIRVRFEITGALARLGDTLSEQVIAGWAVNKFAEDQWMAMQVCADLPPNIGRSPLLLGLENAPPKLPASLDAGDQEIVRRLTARRQLVAARSLAKMGDFAGSKIAIEYATGPDPGLRALAALALGEMLDSRQAKSLDRLLDDPVDEVKRAGAAAIISVYGRAQAAQAAQK